VKVVLYALLVFATASPLVAQSDAPVPPPSTSPDGLPLDTQARIPIRSAVELQLYHFGNFFQATEGQSERGVNAVSAAYRASWSRPGNAPDLYGRLSVMRYANNASETSYAGQFGLSKYSARHWYDAYIEHTRNGYSFDIQDTRASANITSLWGHYSYPVLPKLRVGADTYLDWQRFNVETGSESDYRSLGVNVRYSGFGDIFKPRIGYTVGERDARDPDDSLDDRYWYILVGTEPREGLELSLRYRDRTLEYQNIDRQDDRQQWLLRATLRQNEHFSWVGSWSSEDVDSSAPQKDFDRSTAYVGVTYGF
jgi:hypothetical protein